MKRVVLLTCLFCGYAFGYGFGESDADTGFGGFGSGSLYDKNEYKNDGYRYDTYKEAGNLYDDRKYKKDDEYKYEGFSGEKYKYDLSNPIDRLDYSIDLDAQMKDKLNMPITPGVEIDRSLGQYGGGVKSLFE